MMRDLTLSDPIEKALAAVSAIGLHSDSEVIDACRTLLAHDPIVYRRLEGLVAFIGSGRA